jgi:hypothetical protein
MEFSPLILTASGLVRADMSTSACRPPVLVDTAGVSDHDGGLGRDRRQQWLVVGSEGFQLVTLNR